MNASNVCSLSAVILPAVAVGLLFASVILGAVWVLGECMPGTFPGNRQGFGYAMRNCKTGVSFKREDELKEKIAHVKELLSELD